jgi:TetR/AcrR family fatty acid metabolism transcriptional regulator
VRTKSLQQAEKILAAAAQLFATHRFHEARMEDIAAAAGVGKGTVYRYFQDKNELYEALLARAAEQIIERVGHEAGRAAGPRARVEAVVGVVLSYFDERPHLFDLIQHAEAMHHIHAGSPWQRARDEIQCQLRQAFDEARSKGLFVVRHPDLAILLLGGGLRSVVRFGTRPRPPDLVRSIVDSFLDGAAAPLLEARAVPPHGRVASIS